MEQRTELYEDESSFISERQCFHCKKYEKLTEPCKDIMCGRDVCVSCVPGYFADRSVKNYTCPLKTEALVAKCKKCQKPGCRACERYRAEKLKALRVLAARVEKNTVEWERKNTDKDKGQETGLSLYS